MSSKNALFFISDSRDDIREQLLPSTILALGTDHNGKVAVIQNANSVNQLKMTSYSSTSSLNHSSNYFPLVNGVTKVLPGIFEFLDDESSSLDPVYLLSCCLVLSRFLSSIVINS